MTSNRCIVCGNTRSKGPEVSFHRFPVAKSKRTLWISSLQLTSFVDATIVILSIL